MSDRVLPAGPPPGRVSRRIDIELDKLRARFDAIPTGPRPGVLGRARGILAAGAAGLGGLLDRADDPARTIRRMIAEMEQVLGEVRASAARAIADHKELQRHHAQLVRLQADWTDKAQLAVAKGREDLARAALVEKRKAAELAVQLASESAVLAEAVRAYEDDLARLQSRLREARTRQAAIAARLDSAEQQIKLRGVLAGERVDQALARFDELERRVDEAEGRADALALAEPRRRSGVAGEIAALDEHDAIEAELTAMKRAAAGPGDASGNEG